MNLTLTNLHPSLRLPLNKWRKIIHRMAALFQSDSVFEGFLIRDLSVVWVNDARMAGINEQYLNHSEATDILTFDYGQGLAEIFISLDIASREARAHHQTLEEELTLYLVHGLLHLAGFKDKTSAECRYMRQQENRLIRLLAK